MELLSNVVLGLYRHHGHQNPNRQETHYKIQVGLDLQPPIAIYSDFVLLDVTSRIVIIA